MSRWYRIACLAGLMCLLAPSLAAAQPQQVVRPVGPVARPQFSPYLNLLRNSSPAAINYYGLVRPQMAIQANFGALQQQLLTQQQIGTGTELSSELPLTGQPAVFLNTGGYFLNYQIGASPGTPFVNRPLPGTMIPGPMNLNTATNAPAARAPVMPFRR